jgi:hypothetical protein
MDEERMVVRQNEGSYEKVNQVVSVEQIYGQGGSRSIHG